jgi:hypothetical protein
MKLRMISAVLFAGRSALVFARSTIETALATSHLDSLSRSQLRLD